MNTLLAKRLREKSIPHANDYIQQWMSLNALYKSATGQNERERVKNLIRDNFTLENASIVLANLSNEITYFTQLPPADTRKPDSDLNYRKESTDNLNIVNDSTNSTIERLANLASVLYQIRCNLFHADKHPDSDRDVRLVEYSLNAIREILNKLLPS